jgi:hypothetical protein
MRYRTRKYQAEPDSAPVRVIYFKERNFEMAKKDLILRSPLMRIEQETEDILPEGGFGAVLGRAGVGKTALLIQFALNTLLRAKNVLHVSLNDPVKKVCLWYEEIFRNIALQCNIDRINQLWETLLPHRFIMTFKVEGFTVPKLEERLSDLMEQNIFSPHIILIDGFPFEKSAQESLSDLKALAQKYALHVWFTVQTHRHEKPGPNGMPAPFWYVSDMFEVAIQLQPEGKEIHLKALKGGKGAPNHLSFLLDPSTMLIKNQD